MDQEKRILPRDAIEASLVALGCLLRLQEGSRTNESPRLFRHGLDIVQGTEVPETIGHNRRNEIEVLEGFQGREVKQMVYLGIGIKLDFRMIADDGSPKGNLGLREEVPGGMNPKGVIGFYRYRQLTFKHFPKNKGHFLHEIEIDQPEGTDKLILLFLMVGITIPLADFAIQTGSASLGGTGRKVKDPNLVEFRVSTGKTIGINVDGFPIDDKGEVPCIGLNTKMGIGEKFLSNVHFLFLR
jgi:hypothetical protein